MSEAELIKKRYGTIVEGPSGYRLPEAIARQIEQAAKGAPKEFTYRRRAHAASDFKFEAGERADISFVTTDDPDREGEVVLPGGGDWSTWNRVVPWAHDYHSLPVGAGLWIKSQKTEKGAGLIAKTKYPTAPENWKGDWLPDAIVALMRFDPPLATAKSIGFFPLSTRRPSGAELEARPDWSDARIIDKWMGFEYSCCSIPANPSAEMIAVGKAVRSERIQQLIIKSFTRDACGREGKACKVSKAIHAMDLDELLELPNVSWKDLSDVQQKSIKDRITESVRYEMRGVVDRLLGRV